MGEVYDDRRDVLVPADRAIGAEDLDRVRFTTAVRGYRMDEVDALLARLRTELAEREGAPAEEETASDVDAPRTVGPGEPRGEHGCRGDEHAG